MKKCTAIFLLVCLLLTGCADKIKEPVTFYYIRADYPEDMQNVIVSEQRESSGHREDLSYLMALYFMGPAADDLVSPIPKGVSLLHVSQEAGHITLELSATEKSMSDSEFSLACACLSLTCMDMTQADSVTVNSGSRSVTMTADTLVLQDSGTATKETR